MAQRMGVKPKPRAGTRYAFNDSQKPQTADVPPRSAPPHQGINGGQTEAPKTVTPPESKGGGWRLLLRALPGLIGAGAEGARQAQDYAQRRHDVTQYFGQAGDLGLRVYPEGQPGPGGVKAAFVRRDGSVLPVKVDVKEDVLRYPFQPLKDVVSFDPAELGRHYDLSKLSANDRQRLGLPPAAKPEPQTKPEAGGNGGKIPTGNGIRPDGECDNWDVSEGRPRLPRSDGHWDGAPGNSNWYSNNPAVNAITGGKPIRFNNGQPDFTPWAKMSVNFPPGTLTGVHGADYKSTLAQMAKQFGSEKAAGQYINDNDLTPHHASDTCIQLVPSNLNGLVPHVGSASGLRLRPKN